jgi:hypothetical protein
MRKDYAVASFVNLPIPVDLHGWVLAFCIL